MAYPPPGIGLMNPKLDGEPGVVIITPLPGNGFTYVEGCPGCVTTNPLFCALTIPANARTIAIAKSASLIFASLSSKKFENQLHNHTYILIAYITACLQKQS